MSMKTWIASAMLFNVQDARHPTEVRAQVSIYRDVSRVPLGKKRAVKYAEPVVQDAVMTKEAWETLSRVLAIAGCEVRTTERPW